MFTIRTSLIIPTKDRVVEISHLIRQLNFLKIKFREILVIDSSNDANSKIIKHLCLKNAIKYYKTWASTSHQRNYGLAKIKLSEFIMFMDDDVIFFKKSFYEINKLISNNRNNTQIAGFGFNQTEKIKHDLLEQYSYLEDLDFSLNLKKKNKKILISHLAKFKHPKNIDRSGLDFGMIEVINRYKIVKKHNLSICLFFIASVTRFILSLIKSLAFNKQYFLRAAGNILGYFRILTNLTKVR